MDDTAGSVAPVAREFRFRDGLTIPRVGYGAMRLTGQPGNYGPYADWAGGIALLRAAVDLGIRHVDTARAYGPHDNERLIAEALGKSGGGFAPGVFVATKGGIEKGGPTSAEIRADGSPEALKRHIEESLASLNVGCIDLYYLHRPDRTVPIAQSMAVLAEAKEAGRIARVGVSNVTRAQLDAAMAVVPIDAVQNRYSPADEPNAEIEAMIDDTAAEGIAFVPHGPLGAHPMRHGARVPSGEALMALLARSPNILLIPGTTSIAHLAENAAVLRP